jgi:hypothetical protein
MNVDAFSSNPIDVVKRDENVTNEFQDYKVL